MSDDTDALPCAEKLTFDDQKAAVAMAVTLQHQRGVQLKSYPCRYCQLWHLSSQSDD